MVQDETLTSLIAASDELFMSAFVAAAGNPKEMGRALTYNFWA